MNETKHVSKKRRRTWLFCGEHAIEFVLAVALLLVIGALLSSPSANRALDGDLFGWVVILLIATVSLLVRACTQIPLCAYLRIRRARTRGFTLTGALVIVVAWFGILQFIVQGVVPLLFWEQRTPPGLLNALAHVLETMFTAPKLQLYLFSGLPLYLAAVAAPIVTYKLFGATYDSLSDPRRDEM
jgi:uncharacterized membrane protein YhaH (DUF805 family)